MVTSDVVKPWPPEKLVTSVPPRQVPVSIEELQQLVYDLTAAVERLRIFGFPVPAPDYNLKQPDQG
jgi:hypothetical protein